MKKCFIEKVDQVKIMPHIGRINDINKNKLKSKSFHGHLFVVDGISVGEEFLDPNKPFLPTNNEARFSQVQWSACVWPTMHFLCSETTVLHQLSSFQWFSNYFTQVGTSIVNGLWYGADCDETPMFGVCEIEPL